MIIDLERHGFLTKYSKKDVTEMACKMARYLEDISAEIPGATTLYNNFVQEARNARRIGIEVCRFLFMVNTA